MRIPTLILLLLTTTTFAQTTKPTVPISRADKSKYTVEGNISYGPNPTQLIDMLYSKNIGPSTSYLYPGVIMFHGGGWIRTDKSTMSSFYNRFLAHGFVVCNVEYRMASKDAEGNYTATSALAPAAVEDALTAAKWFADHAQQYHVDPDRIIVTGASAGGHLALMVGLCTPEAQLGPTTPKDFKIAAIVNGYGPADVTAILGNDAAAKQWLPQSLPNWMDLARRVSPTSYVHKDIPPLLTVIGSNDHGVSANRKLVAQLKAAGADAEIHEVQGAGHGFNSPQTAWPDAEKTIFDFLTTKKILPAAP
ncbi:MAG: alpha/beta hydrolase [Planctomycetota bacterium]|nr:alpha/beta hydrolase [Planctomycetota bacterium]